MSRSVMLQHARDLEARALLVKQAIENVRSARAEQTRALEAASSSLDSAGTLAHAVALGHARARCDLAELAEYHALRDYFAAGEFFRNAYEAL